MDFSFLSPPPQALPRAATKTFDGPAVLEAQKAAFFLGCSVFFGCEVKNLPTSDVQRPRTQIVDINVY